MTKEFRPPAYPPTIGERVAIAKRISPPTKHEAKLLKGKTETYFVFKRVEMTTRDGRKIAREITVFAKDIKEAVETVVVMINLANTILEKQANLILRDRATFRMKPGGAFSLIHLDGRIGRWLDITPIDQFGSAPAFKRIKHGNKKLGFNLNQVYKEHPRSGGRWFKKIIGGAISKFPGTSAINKRLGIFTWADYVDQIVSIYK